MILNSGVKLITTETNKMSSGNYLNIKINDINNLGPIITFNDGSMIQVTKDYAQRYFRDDLKDLPMITLDINLYNIRYALDNVTRNDKSMIDNKGFRIFKLFNKSILYNCIKSTSETDAMEDIMVRLFYDIMVVDKSTYYAQKI